MRASKTMATPASKVHVITYVTRDKGYSAMLRRNPMVTVLGWGAPWRGFRDKVQGVLDYAAAHDLADDDLLCFVDGFDSVLLTRDRGEISTKFASFDADIVFARERTSPGAVTEYVRRRVFGNCSFNDTTAAGHKDKDEGEGDDDVEVAMNSGLWAGTVAAARRLWGSMPPGEDDQVHAARWCRASRAGEKKEQDQEQEPRVVVDAACVLFYNFSSADRLVAPLLRTSSTLRTRTDDGIILITAAHPRSPGRILVSVPDVTSSSPRKRRWTEPCAVSAPGSDDMNALLYAAGYEEKDLPDMRVYPYAYHFGIFFRQWAFRQLLPETLLVLALLLTLVILIVVLVCSRLKQTAKRGRRT